MRHPNTAPRLARFSTSLKLKSAVSLLLFLVIAMGTSWAQSDDGQSAAENESENTTSQIAGAADANSAVDANLDSSEQVSAESSAAQSYILAGVHVSGGADSNPRGASGSSSQFSSALNFAGSVNLLKFWHRSQTSVEYAGGSTLDGYSGNLGTYDRLFHKLDVEQDFFWRRAELNVRNSFRSLRESDFGSSSFGGASAYNLRFAGAATDLIPGVSARDSSPEERFINLDHQSSIGNTLSAQFTESLTPRSSLSLGSSFHLVDYLGNSAPLLNGRQFSANVGYNYQLDGRNEVGLVYEYRAFEFTHTGAGDVVTNSAQLIYKRHISGHMDFSAGAGPELTAIHSDSSADTQEVNVAAHASLEYRPQKSSTLSASYNRLVTSGSGLFVGGNSNIARISFTHNIHRAWRTSFDAGYAQVSSLAATLPNAINVRGNSYQYSFAGAAIQKRLGRYFDVFASYQFNHQNLDNFSCGTSTICSPGLRTRHIALIGFDWRIRPRRLE